MVDTIIAECTYQIALPDVIVGDNGMILIEIRHTGLQRDFIKVQIITQAWAEQYGVIHVWISFQNDYWVNLLLNIVYGVDSDMCYPTQKRIATVAYDQSYMPLLLEDVVRWLIDFIPFSRYVRNDKPGLMS